MIDWQAKLSSDKSNTLNIASVSGVLKTHRRSSDRLITEKTPPTPEIEWCLPEQTRQQRHNVLNHSFFLLKTLFFPKLTSSLIPFYALHPFEIHSCVSVWGVQKWLFFVFFSLSIHLTWFLKKYNIEIFLKQFNNKMLIVI